MEKIIVAVDAARVSRSVVDFACYLSNLTQSRLTGIFLEFKEGEEMAVVKNVHGLPYMETIIGGDFPENKAKDALCQRNIILFEEACKARGVHTCVHCDEGVPLAEVIAESRFADLLVVDPEMSFGDKGGSLLTGFVQEVLAKSECPVVVAPFHFYGISELLFAYDGSAASMFALKQFSYLFPELGDKKITVLQVNEGGERPIVDREKVDELLRVHYSCVDYRVLDGQAGEALFGFLLGRRNTLVVLGAFGPSLLSTFLRRRVADVLIGTLNLPLFIPAHY